jgi:hypothetical protein
VQAMAACLSFCLFLFVCLSFCNPASSPDLTMREVYTWTQLVGYQASPLPPFGHPSAVRCCTTRGL